jgi:hypothetical protein
MRLAALSRLLLPLLLVDCGSRGDLFIGELLIVTEGGAAGASGSSAGAEPNGGVLSTAGAGGSTDVGGSSDVGGGDVGGSASSAGAGAGGEQGCTDLDQPPPGSLVHRYSLDGTGAVAIDSISGDDGEIVGTMLNGDGTVTMKGDSRQYIDLPNGIISSLTDVTVVTWVTWGDGAAYQRIFDFGSSSSGSGEGLGTTGRSYMAVMPKTGFADQAKPGLGGEIKVPGLPTVTLASTETMKNRTAMVGFVFRGGVSASLYIEDRLLATQATAITPGDINDVNNWIGQSQYQDNPFYQGGYQEFRIYNVALDACQLHTLLIRGRESP